MPMIRKLFILFVFAFGVFSALQVFGQDISKFGECPVEYGFRHSYDFGKPHKSYVRVEKLEEIPPLVLAEIQKQLKSRVGEKFFQKLQLDYGSAVDFDDVAALRADDAGRIDDYEFVFKFSDESKGLTNFYFTLAADAKGKLLGELALPDIAADPQKGDLIPCREALKIAKKNGFPSKRSRIYFIYDWDSGKFVWVVYDEKKLPTPGFTIGIGTYRNIYIDAGTGRVVKIFNETIAV
jgi:hypothetical protein